jgi:glucan biosynthesis protein C
MPPIKYFELRSGLDANYTGLYVSPALQPSFATVIPQGLPAMAPFDETFVEFLPTFFTHLDRFTWAHLWFVAYLLVFTVLLLPLFRWLRTRRGELAHAPAWWIYLPILPLALVQVTLRPHWPGLQNLYDDWANVGYYATYLLAGFLLARHPALERAVHAEWRRALGVGLAATLVLLLGVLGVVAAPPVLLAGTAIAGWCFVLALLGAAQRFVSERAAGLSYLTESAFPVYWLHQSAIVLIGYPILQLRLGIAAKYALLLVASVSATLAVYHFAVRRLGATRFLVGMKARPRTPAAQREVRLATGGSAAS